MTIKIFKHYQLLLIMQLLKTGKSKRNKNTTENNEALQLKVNPLTKNNNVKDKQIKD